MPANRTNDPTSAAANQPGTRAPGWRVLKLVGDGRTFSGRPIDIAREMQFLAFGWDDRPLGEYIAWAASRIPTRPGIAAPNTKPATGAGSEAEGPGKEGSEVEVEAAAAALVDAMVAHGVAVEIITGGASG